MYLSNDSRAGMDSLYADVQDNWEQAFSSSPPFKEMSVSISILIYRVRELSLAATSATPARCAPRHLFQGGSSQRL